MKVSVIIPIYNVEPYLRKCLDSVCNQTLEDIEIICINDCSTDNSLAILNEYQDKDNRIKIIDFKENKGASVARNTGMAQAAGEYIGFVDSDDWVSVDFYEKLYSVASKGSFESVKGNGKSVYENQPSLSRAVFNFWVGIYSRDALTRKGIWFKEGCICGEDQIFMIKTDFLLSTSEVVCDVIYYYYQRQGSASFDYRKDERHFESDLIAFKEVAEFLSDMIRETRFNEKERINKWFFSLLSYMARLNKDQANKYLNMLRSELCLLGELDAVLTETNKPFLMLVRELKANEIIVLLEKVSRKQVYDKLRLHHISAINKQGVESCYRV